MCTDTFSPHNDLLGKCCCQPLFVNLKTGRDANRSGHRATEMMDLGSELELSSFRDPSLNHNTIYLSITGVTAKTSPCVLSADLRGNASIICTLQMRTEAQGS